MAILDTELPLVAAPMAGGPTTVALAAAVADAGGFPFLAGGYKTPDALASDMHALRTHHEKFGVNVFVPSPEHMESSVFAAYAEELRADFSAHGLVPDTRPVWDDDHWGEKLALLRKDPVAVVSFTFGLPARTDIAALRRVGTQIAATVTSVPEAHAALEAGVDVLIVQGAAAGGHSATFDPTQVSVQSPTADVVRAVAAEVTSPLVAAGGVDGARATRDLIAAGAHAVAIGTLLVRTDESGTSQTHQDALADERFTQTAVTRAFTGRPARGLRNGFIDRHSRTAPLGYPEIHHLTRPLRAAAARAGDAERLHLWAGTGYRAARRGPATAVIEDLAAGL